jgi:hypothetical protein
MLVERETATCAMARVFTIYMDTVEVHDFSQGP